jgi:hypothetical protein
MIMSKNESLQYIDKLEVVRVLKEAVQNGDNRVTLTQHIENIKDILGKHTIDRCTPVERALR